MKKNELAKEIYNVSNIKGEFLLRSGQISNEYFDKYLFESKPDLLREIGIHMKTLLPDNFDLLAALEMGGIPVATVISLETGYPIVFVRKEAKKYGTCKLAEGAEVNDKKLVIIEDVVTSGGAILDAARELRKLGAEMDTVLCVIDREGTGKENLAKEGLDLVPLFSKSELEASVKS
ncbi:MAG: orotate phosphoribosyltransferase [Desulfobacterales bacterium]|nr:orotate phosphoribosyltransferase [Desulfobacterales bacterium]